MENAQLPHFLMTADNPRGPIGMLIDRKLSLLIAALLISALSSCASSGPPFAPVSTFDQDKALIYIYREKGGAGALVQHYLHVENKRQVNIANGGYSVLEVTPGKKVIGLSSKAAAGSFLIVGLEKAIYGSKAWEVFSFEARAGETYYLKFRLNTPNEDRTVGHSVVLVDSSIAKDEIAKCNKIELLTK